MHLRYWLLYTLLCGVLLGTSPASLAGTIGFPAPRQKPLHLRFELVGDSFKADITGDADGEANSGRGLVTVALGLTDWSEIYGRAGVGEFNIDEALFNGNFGFAYGGGVRVRLFKLSWADVGITGQYLRFTSDDDDSAGVRVEGEWQEFDVGVGFGSRRFGLFQFYAGGAYHRSEITLTAAGSGTRTDFESDLPVRAFVGAHIYPLGDFPLGKFLINLEVRFIGEIPQVTLGVQYAF